MGASHAAGVTSADAPLFLAKRSDFSGLRPTVIANTGHGVIDSRRTDVARNRFLCAIIPVIASKTPRCDRCARHVRPQPVSADRCSPCPRRGGLPSLITMVVSPPSVRRLASPVTRPTRRPSRSLVTSRPWRASRDRHRRRPSRHAAARPARMVGHARAVRARGIRRGGDARTSATALRARRAIGTRRQGHAPERPSRRPDLGGLRHPRPSPDGSPAAPPPRRSRRRRRAPRGWAADAIPAVHHVEAMLPTRREDWYTRTSRVVLRGTPPCWWAVRSPVLCPVSGARRGAGAPAQRIDSRYARRVTRRSTPSLPRMLLR